MRNALLVVLALTTSGCGSMRTVEVPKEVKVAVVSYVEIPESLTAECHVPPKRDNSVGEALRVSRDRRTCNEQDAADKRAIRKISNTAVGL